MMMMIIISHNRYLAERLDGMSVSQVEPDLDFSRKVHQRPRNSIYSWPRVICRYSTSTSSCTRRDETLQFILDLGIGQVE